MYVIVRLTSSTCSVTFLRGTHEKIVMSAADHPKLVVSGACSYRLTKVYLFYVNSFMTFSEQNGYPILSLLMLIDQPENKFKLSRS